MLDVHISVKNPFFIFFPERSGSTFLVHLLNQHEQVFCEHELFSAHRVDSDKPYFNKLINDDSEKTQLLEKVYSYQKAEASGFKFKFRIQYQAYPEVYRFFMRHVESMKMIFLYRENLLKMAISGQNLGRLFKSGQHHYKKPEDKQEIGKLNLNLKNARSYIARQRKELNFFRRATEVFEQRLLISYEELNANTDSTMNKIFDFLDVGPIQNLDCSPIQKITKDSLVQAVENYDEMVGFFQDTPFEEYLEM